MPPFAGALAIALAVVGLAAASAPPERAAASSEPGAAQARLPFAPGENAEYQVRLGGVSVGRGSLEVLGTEVISGRTTYRTRLHVSGGIPLARVDTRMESWIDVEGLYSRRFEQDQHEIRYRRHRIIDFYPESRTYRQRDTNEVGRLPTDQPLDDLSFLFYARTLPLRPGDSYTISRYYKDDGNPVVLNVLRRERVTVPAGTFDVVVVQPIIQTDGLFSQGGQAEVYFTDDERRILVHMRSRVPVVGSLTLNLRSYEPGGSAGR